MLTTKQKATDERIQRLRFLIQRTADESTLGGYRGGQACAVKRADNAQLWTHELTMLLRARGE